MATRVMMRVPRMPACQIRCWLELDAFLKSRASVQQRRRNPVPRRRICKIVLRSFHCSIIALWVLVGVVFCGFDHLGNPLKFFGGEAFFFRSEQAHDGIFYGAAVKGVEESARGRFGCNFSRTGEEVEELFAIEPSF